MNPCLGCLEAAGCILLASGLVKSDVLHSFHTLPNTHGAKWYQRDLLLKIPCSFMAHTALLSQPLGSLPGPAVCPCAVQQVYLGRRRGSTDDLVLWSLAKMVPCSLALPKWLGAWDLVKEREGERVASPQQQLSSQHCTDLWKLYDNLAVLDGISGLFSLMSIVKNSDCVIFHWSSRIGKKSWG